MNQIIIITIQITKKLIWANTEVCMYSCILPSKNNLEVIDQIGVTFVTVVMVEGYI